VVEQMEFIMLEETFSDSRAGYNPEDETTDEI
jgi:hypothetical protein